MTRKFRGMSSSGSVSRSRKVRSASSVRRASRRAVPRTLESLEDRHLLAITQVTGGTPEPVSMEIPDWLSPTAYYTAYGGAFSRSRSDGLIALNKIDRFQGLDLVNSASRTDLFQVNAQIRLPENEPFIPVGNEDPFVNNTPATAQLVQLGFRENQFTAIDIRGSIGEPDFIVEAAFTEDDGTILTANATGLETGGVVGYNAAIGDLGNGGYDVDFYEVLNVQKGQLLTASVEVDRLLSVLDPAVVIYNSSGEIVAFNDDVSPTSLDSYLAYSVEEADDYYILVYDVTAILPPDPFRSSIALPGNQALADYRLEIGLDGVDQDWYAMDLHGGDILGLNTVGASRTLEIFKPGGEDLIIGSSQDLAQFIHPSVSPLPFGGDAAVSYVIPSTGRYLVRATGPTAGRYTMDMRLFRPVLEQGDRGAHQILYLDFNGQTINGSIFGNDPTPVRTLTPLSTFLPNWGLSGASENAVIDEIIKVVKENLVSDLKSRGRNPNFELEIRNSRDHQDPYGLPNVSRIVIGGTILELGIPTIGIAETVDVGNFKTEETAVVLLDLLSAPLGDPNSLNQYLVATNIDRKKVELLGAGIGNIVAHEAGHFFGTWHTDQFNDVPNIMDQGGNLLNTVGAGDDRVWGTQDDVDVDFVTDEYVPNEGFTGFQDTLNSIAWGLTTGRGATVSASGLVWNDLDGDGVRDAGEPGLADILIYGDTNNDGRFGIGEPAGRSRANGTYTLSGLKEGRITLRAVIPPGSVQTAPANNGGHTVVVDAADPIVNRNFGIRQGQAVNEGIDYGDAPAPYPTRAAANGASAGILPGFRLGETIDGDGDPVLDAAANGDDTTGVDDEDGVVFLTELIAGRSASIQVTVNNGGNPRGVLQGWIDFNRNGAWEAGEQIIRDRQVNEGVNTISFQVPLTSVAGDTYARFRYGYERGIGVTGRAVAGEVEDYRVALLPPPVITPTAVDDQYTVNGNSTNNSLLVLSNDQANVPGTLTIIGVSSASQGGTVAVSTDRSRLVYTPLNGFSGSETFTYTIRNGDGGEDEGSVSITVRPIVVDKPDAINDTFTVDQDTQANVLDLLANDKTPPGESLVISAVGTPSQGGSAAISGDQQTVSYTPAEGFFGTETFTYTVRSGAGDTDTATVTVTVDEIQIGDQLVRFRVETLNSAGTQSISSVNVGQSFKVRVTADDLRDSPLGIFGAYVDLLYPSGLVSVNGSLVYGDHFTVARAGSTSTAGILDEVGGLGGLDQTNRVPHIVFTIDMLANAAGTATFSTNQADQLPLHDVLLYGIGVPIGSDDLIFDSTNLTIRTPGGPTLTNIAQPLDVNNDGSISPLDGLLVINELNRIAGAVANSGLSPEGEASGYFLDVNGDGLVSPVDALLVINWLNQTSTPPPQPAPPASSDVAAAVDGVWQAEGESAGSTSSLSPVFSALASDVASAKKKFSV